MPLRVFMAVPMTISAAVADFGAAGDSFAARADLCHQYSLSPVSLTPVRNNQKAKLFTGANDTADKFFGGVSDTGD